MKCFKISVMDWVSCMRQGMLLLFQYITHVHFYKIKVPSGTVVVTLRLKNVVNYDNLYE